MKRLIPFILLLSLLAMQACKEASTEVGHTPRPVKTTVVGSIDHGRQWTFAGTAEDALATELSFRVSGKIVQFPGDQVGRKFRKGEVIAKLDPEDYELRLRQANANMEQVRANFIRAKADMERNSELYERNVISKGEFDRVEADFRSYEAQLYASAKELEIARKQLKYTILRAPYDGWIGRVETRVYNNVSTGQAVVSFNAGRQMKMLIAVPDTLIGLVNEGDDVEVRFDALPGRTMHGEVMEISVDSTAGSAYPVRVYLDNEEQRVRSGMTGHVSFMAKKGMTSSFLPAVAVISHTNGTRMVWVVDSATSTVVSRTVTVGPLTAMGLEIVEGIKPGDIVVTHGVHHLKDGQKVRFTQTDTEG